MKCLPQLRSDLEPVHTVWQIVVCKNEVRSHRPTGRQFLRYDAVRRRYHAMALGFEKKRQEFAHVRIVLDDQNHAGVANTCSSPVIHAVSTVIELWQRSARREHDLDGE